jgi:glycosyltransferase involved in cell wall biosynthesis
VAIVAPSSEVARVIEESGCGVQVPQGDGQRLAEVLQEMVAAPERVQQMGECARRVFEDKYTLAKVAAQYHSIFEATRQSR